MGGSQVNQALVRLYFEVRDGLRDPVAAWAKLTGNSQQYQRARGERRVPLDDGTAAELAAAAIVCTATRHGPERVAALATSPLAGVVGGLGGAVLTEHPCAPEQVLGPCYTGPGADDWARAAYVLLWGENNRLVRTAGTPWVIAGRYKGQKVVAIGTHPTRLSDETLVVRPGTDGALAMAMGHVLLKEFFLDRTPFDGHAMERTDLPYLVRLRGREDAYVPGELTGGACGRLSVYGGEAVEVLLPRFDDGPGVLRRGVPVLRDGDDLVTTVFDLLLAVYGVARPGLPGVWPAGYEDRAEPYTPAWQEAYTGVAASRALKTARELGVTAEKTGGRCVIVPGRLETPHADTAYRAMLALLVLTGCGGGWAQTGGAGIPLVPYLCLHACGEDRSDVGALSWALAEGLFARRTARSVLLEAVADGWPMAPPPRVLALPRPIYPLPPEVDLLIGPDEHCDLSPPEPGLLAEAVARLAGSRAPAEPGGAREERRMRLLVDHAWMHEYGEALPTYRPPGLGLPLKPTQLVRFG
ncbi:molybdopterin-dependent oxidoreductase [Nonomuraea fuscirosea]|uniref:Molybdopterin-dependent oxidoreductase-like protein n=1 Tax=Nonomuraea fuscirosea TaxID=1291556 RepID=A0A2T0M4U6_9ACTN|nr:molybdopterin-dependent oxidoreductase [Nonomuraea fuscirosea]PRX52073.1 molybdopterin-dependent oxidoreductase-like protein [Nonomuraea fuscirosea]WSA49566.1 molybdopterin-dependent oxidoreductase [Nonomuraea fuscirosea]